MRLRDLFDKSYRRMVRGGNGTDASQSVNRMVWHRFCRNRLSVFSLVVIALFALIAVLGYSITPDGTPDCNQQYLELASLKPGSKATFLCIDPKDDAGGSFFKGHPLAYTAIPVKSVKTVGDSVLAEPVSGAPYAVESSRVAKVQRRTFLLGTDNYGRDMLSMLMIGSRVSLSVGFIAIFIALVIGITLGAIAAYRGGWVDNVIMWLINVVWSIPTVLLVIAITFALGKGFWQVFVAVGLTMWVDIARVVRGQVLSIKEKEYVQAARALGYSSGRTIFRHILPNIAGPVVVVAASNFASAILLEAGLSFLGIGVQPPTPSWGSMVKEYYGYILLDSAYMALLPGAAIMIIVLAFMLLANGLRDALDVR
ncbi:MAG: ABC transporter permease [Bacteroidales bacterium]|nr:ABC transporter permease [Bacteroidales bacterium]